VRLSAWNLRLCANTEFSPSLMRAGVVFLVLADVANDNEAPLVEKQICTAPGMSFNEWNRDGGIGFSRYSTVF
jgi:hypothetical protein